MLKGIAIFKLSEIDKYRRTCLEELSKERQICRCEVFTSVVIVIA